MAITKCTCGVCGYEWFEFNHGDHDCIENLKNRLAWIKEILLGPIDETKDVIEANRKEIYELADI